MISTNDLQQALLDRQGKWQGKELVFLCPCHDDHHPSARWNPEKRCWYCFVCGNGGGRNHLMTRLGFKTDERVGVLKNHTSLNAESFPRFVFDWRSYSTTLSFLADDYYLRSECVFTAAKGLDTSLWTDTDFEAACNAVGEGYQDRLLYEALQDLSVTLRSYGLEEERARHESRRCNPNSTRTQTS